MNRSILIVICDFLLVSLLAFSSVDINNVADNGVAKPMNMATMGTNQQAASSGDDLNAAMRLALEEERRNRDQLQNELAQTRQAVTQRDQQVQTFQQQLDTRDQEAKRLQQQETALQQ